MPTQRTLLERKRSLPGNSCHRNNNGNYVGLASNFKERNRNHQTSFRHPSKRNETELSKYIWDLKDQKKSFRVKWRVLRSCQPYSNETKKCNLCLQDKYFIIFRKDLSSSCRQRNRFTLKFFRIT